jgi:hypothetical protein
MEQIRCWRALGPAEDEEEGNDLLRDGSSLVKETSEDP